MAHVAVPVPADDDAWHRSFKNEWGLVDGVDFNAVADVIQNRREIVRSAAAFASTQQFVECGIVRCDAFAMILFKDEGLPGQPVDIGREGFIREIVFRAHSSSSYDKDEMARRAL